MPKRTDPITSFTAYRNYLRAIRYVVAKYYGVGSAQYPALSEVIQCRGAYERIKRREYARPERLARQINMAWQTEIALNLPLLIKDEEFSALSIQWGSIQLYYAIYSAASAWLEAMQGESAPKGHRAVLNALSDHATTKAMFPLPWGAACRTSSPVSFCGELAGFEPDDANALRSPTYDDALDLMCLSLKTTRVQELDRRAAEWKREQRKKRIPAQKRAGLDKFAPTTLFDFLWRLRVRANYSNAELFLAGSDDKYESDAAKFLVSLSRIGRTTLFLFEKLLCRTYGKANMMSLAEGFLQKSRYGDLTLGERLPYW